MPMAAPTMPPSEIGVSKHARLAVLRLQAFGAAEHAAEIADVLAEDDARWGRAPASRPSPSCSAWIMVMRAPCVRPPAAWRCSAQMPRHVLVDVLEHRRGARHVGPSCERAVALGLLAAAAAPRASSSACDRVVLAPRDHSPRRDQMLLQPRRSDRRAARRALRRPGGIATDRRWSNGRRRDR